MNLNEMFQTVSRRLLFVLATTAVLVFISEKVFWYPQGFVLSELLLFYAFPTYAMLWALAFFRVQHLEAVILCAAFFAFLVEGVLTPVLFEGGLLDPIMPAYFIGWHGMLAVVFGWVWVGQMLRNGRWRLLLLSSILFGLLWGGWSVTYWLPETFVDFDNPGQWPVADFARYTVTYTLVFVAGHWLLGRSRLEKFEPGRFEGLVVSAGLLFFYATLSFLAAPFGLLKLAALLLLIGLPLFFYRQHQPASAALSQLAGRVQVRHLLPLGAMPLTASGVYAAVAAADPGAESLRLLLELTPLLWVTVGALALLWAVGKIGWGLRRQSYAPAGAGRLLRAERLDAPPSS